MVHRHLRAVSRPLYLQPVPSLRVFQVLFQQTNQAKLLQTCPRFNPANSHRVHLPQTRHCPISQQLTHRFTRRMHLRLSPHCSQLGRLLHQLQYPQKPLFHPTIRVYIRGNGLSRRQIYQPDTHLTTITSLLQSNRFSRK